MSTTVIKPTRGLLSLGFRELWDRRELLYFLAMRDVKVRYKQSLIGIAWVVIQPVMTMLIFSIVFGRLAGLPSDGKPYALLTYAAILPWQLFANSLTRSTNSVVSNNNLIQKVYVPRLLIPTSTVLSALVDFAVASLVYIVLMIYYTEAPTFVVLALPFFVLLAISAALGVGLWLSALNARYRDVAHSISFLVQFWMYASPVAYSASLIPDRWQMLYSMNPMVGVIEGFRWCLLGTNNLEPLGLFASSVMTILLLVTGVMYFRRTERTFADVI